MQKAPIIWSENTPRRYQPTTLKKLGKNEAFLEQLIVDNFDVLGLDSMATGLRGPYVCWQQIPLDTPEGRTIFPDIVAISESGHFIVVEVKLGTNSELKSRKVLSQIIDYASSFSAYSMTQLMTALGVETTDETTWEEFIGDLFPDHSNISELAKVLGQRISDGDVNLLVACDFSPLGSRELLRGVATQSAVGFQLDLVQLTPYVATEGGTDEILFIPERELTTEIIARTAVTIRYEEGDLQPGVSLQTSSVEDIKENLDERSGRRNLGKHWTAEEVEAAFKEIGSPVENKLLQFCKQRGHNNKLISDGPKKNAAFGFYVPILLNDKPHTRMVFNCTLGWDHVWVYMRFAQEAELGEELNALYIRKLNTAFDQTFDFTAKIPGIPLETLDKHYDAFTEVMDWLIVQLSERNVAH